MVARSLKSLGVSFEVVFDKAEETIGPTGPARAASPPFTPRSKKVLELSLREARQLGHDYIGTEHLLLGLIRGGQGVAMQVIQALGMNPIRVRERVMTLLRSRQPKRTLHGATYETAPHGRDSRRGFSPARIERSELTDSSSASLVCTFTTMAYRSTGDSQEYQSRSQIGCGVPRPSLPHCRTIARSPRLTSEMMFRPTTRACRPRWPPNSMRTGQAARSLRPQFRYPRRDSPWCGKTRA